jgi:hypothetical protein
MKENILVYSLYSSDTKVLVDVTVLSEHGTVIKSDFKLGSVERSIDLYQRGNTSAGDIFNFRLQ